MHYTLAMPFELRKVESSDLGAIVELNESVVPAVNSVPLEKMQWFAQHASYFKVAVDADGVGAFLIGLRAGVPYESPNYQWFCASYPDFAYIDRVAVADRARRQGLASRLYDDFELAQRSEVSVMTCEVNLEPPNPGSMRYHEQRGFRQIGSQATEGGRKIVALLEKAL